MLLAARPTISFKKSEIKKTETPTRKRSNAAHLQFISYTNANCNSFCPGVLWTFLWSPPGSLLNSNVFFLLFPSPVFAASSRLLKKNQFVQENNKKKKSLFLVLVLSSLFSFILTHFLCLFSFFLYIHLFLELKFAICSLPNTNEKNKPWNLTCFRFFSITIWYRTPPPVLHEKSIKWNKEVDLLKAIASKNSVQLVNLLYSSTPDASSRVCQPFYPSVTHVCPCLYLFLIGVPKS